MRLRFISALKNEFIHGTIVLTAMSFGVNIMNYLFNLIVAHQLGPEIFGDMAAMLSYLAVFSIPIGVLNLVIIQKIAGSGNKRISYAKATEKWLFTRLYHWWFLLVIGVFIPPIFSYFTHISQEASYALFFILFFSVLGGFYDAIFQGARLFNMLALSTITSIGIKLLGALILLHVVGTYQLLLVFLVLSVALKYILCSVYLSVKFKDIPHVVFSKRIIDILKHPSIFVPALSLLGITLMSNVDVMIVKKFFSSTDAGIYSSWSLLAKVIMYGAGSFLSISFIFFSSSDQKKNHKRIFGYSLVSLLVISLTGIMFYSFAGTFIVHLFFGNTFSSVIQYLPLAGIFGSGYLMVFYINHYFVSQKSKFALIIPASTPLYIAALIFYSHSLRQIMMVNISFTLVLIVVYLCLIIFERTRGSISIETYEARTF